MQMIQEGIYANASEKPLKMIGSPQSIVKAKVNVLLTITTAAQNEVALSYHRMRGLYFRVVVFATPILPCCLIISRAKDSIYVIYLYMVVESRKEVTRI